MSNLDKVHEKHRKTIVTVVHNPLMLMRYIGSRPEEHT